MVCYARPASRLAAIVLVAWLVFAGPASHFFDTAAWVTAVLVATVGAAVAAALAFVTFMSVRRRRAAAGGCVSCQFRCQHAMTEPGRRLWLVTIADRRPPVRAADRPATAPGRPSSPGHRGTAPARSVPVLLPMPAVRPAASAPATAGAESCGPAAPRWPDRPAYRAAQVVRGAPGAAHIQRRERAGSPALAAGHRACGCNTGDVRITIWVRPGSAHPAIGGERAGALIVQVGARAVDGKATEAALTSVASAFGVRRSAVTLVTGMSSRTKIVEVAGGDPAVLTQLLARPGR
jgi:uncharacterized protein